MVHAIFARLWHVLLAIKVIKKNSKSSCDLRASLIIKVSLVLYGGWKYVLMIGKGEIRWK